MANTAVSFIQDDHELLRARPKAIDSTEGTHVIVELWGCDPRVLVDEELCLGVLRDCAKVAGATIVHEHSHRFGEGGVSAILILQESHVSVHCWDVQGFVSADMYTCGDCEPERAIPVMKAGFKAKRVVTKVIARGIRGSSPR